MTDDGEMHWGKIITLARKSDGKRVNVQDWRDAGDRWFGIPTNRDEHRIGYLKSDWERCDD